MDEKVANQPVPEPKMREFWPDYRRQTVAKIIGTQTAVVFFGLLLCDLNGILKVGWIGLATMTIVGAGTLAGLTLLFLYQQGRPFRDLVQAVLLAAGEPSPDTPPNPNRTEYEKNGFKKILQFVYEQASRKDGTDAEDGITDSASRAIMRGLDGMQTGIVIMDGGRNVIYHNEKAPVRMDTDDKPVLDVIFSDDNSLATWLAGVSKAKVTAEQQWMRVANKLPGEKDRRIFDMAASFRKGSTAETVLTFFDRTSSYSPEEDELDFLSFAAHELRGPITVIRGYLDVLNDELQPVLEDDQAELMKRLIVASNRLTNYVNNVLNAARYDRRHMKLHLSEETLKNIYSQISDDMQMRAGAQNRVLVVDIPEDLPTIAADSPAVGEVMSNLIDNAIKYSNEGGLVRVNAHAISGFVEITIIDRGIGMPSSVLPNLFHKFYRSHRSRETVAGTGIGLYICKAIVSSHGGTMDVRSIENEGSTFSFTLPIYDTVAEKLKASHNSNAALIEHGGGWIRNHSKIRR
jgi:signal transduction histidine kinase